MTRRPSAAPNLPRAALAVTLAALLATVGPARAGGSLEPPQTLGEVNRCFHGHRATIELADGSRIERARRVELGPTTTTFRAHGQRQRIATQHISEVSISAGDGPLWAKYLFWVLIASLVGGVFVVFDEDPGIASDRPDASGGAAGQELGARLDRRPTRVVYEAPLGRYLTDTRSASAPG